MPYLRQLHARALGQLGHERQPSRGAEIDARPIHLFDVESVASRAGAATPVGPGMVAAAGAHRTVRPFRDVAYLHGATGQLEAVHLLQGLLGVVRIHILKSEQQIGIKNADMSRLQKESIFYVVAAAVVVGLDGRWWWWWWLLLLPLVVVLQPFLGWLPAKVVGRHVYVSFPPPFRKQLALGNAAPRGSTSGPVLYLLYFL